jgi:hypothetical protein
MPIFINTRQESCESRINQAFLPNRLQQSLTRFLSDPNASKICMDSKYENLQVPDNSLSANTGSRMEDSVFTVSTSVPINRLVYRKMLRSLNDIRRKWAIISKASHIENVGQIMIATQNNLIGLSAISNRDNHPHDRSRNGVHVGDESIIHDIREPELALQEINNITVNEVKEGSFLRTGSMQVINDLHPIQSLDQTQAETCDHRDVFRKRNYRYPDVIHSLQLNKIFTEKTPFQRTLYIFYAALADRLNNMHRAFLQCLQSVAHSRKQVALFLEYKCLRYGDVILLLSRTTMRRVKFLYEKPPTTLSV